MNRSGPHGADEEILTCIICNDGKPRSLKGARLYAGRSKHIDRRLLLLQTPLYSSTESGSFIGGPISRYQVTWGATTEHENNSPSPPELSDVDDIDDYAYPDEPLLNHNEYSFDQRNSDPYEHQDDIEFSWPEDARTELMLIDTDEVDRMHGNSLFQLGSSMASLDSQALDDPESDNESTDSFSSGMF